MWGWGVPTPRKETRRKEQVKEKSEEKGIEIQRVKPLTPTRAFDELIGDEEPTGKKKKEQKEKQGAGLQPSYPGPFGSLIRPAGIIR